MPENRWLLCIIYVRNIIMNTNCYVYYFRMHGSMKILIAVVLMVIVYIYVCCYFSKITEVKTFRTDAPLRRRKKAHTVDSPTCKIPNLKPFDVSVSKYFFHFAKYIHFCTSLILTSILYLYLRIFILICILPSYN